tara:strand:+ start:661 stop:891 length:231 start_codon:yes stop_codon:yes gene_type:complete
MDSIVKLKLVKTDETKEFTFKHAQEILRIDKHKDFEIADKKKFQFINNDLIKRPSPKVSKRTAKPKGDIKGGEVSE